MLIVLALATSALSLLAAVSANAPKCTHQDLVQDYRTGFLDFLAFPVFSLISAVAVARGRTSHKTVEFVAINDVPVLELGRLRVTLGAALVCSSVFSFILISATMTGFSAQRYFAIVQYCGFVTGGS